MTETLETRLAEALKRLEMASEFSVGDGLVIAQRSRGLWAIRDGYGNVMNTQGEWEHEPMPSSRNNEFIARTRFTLDEAFDRLGDPMPA